MPWAARRLTLYHGTVGPHADDIVQRPAGRANNITLNICRPISDFGRGFYTTRIFDQAAAFANSRFQLLQGLHALHPGTMVAPQHAAVVEFSVVLDALGALDTLAFVQPTGDWLDFVRFCHSPSPTAHKASGKYYDAVYGPVWAVGSGAEPDWEQLSLHSDYAISLLRVDDLKRGRSGGLF
jgi:hypothetical protein